jgi:hypothetical protein
MDAATVKGVVGRTIEAAPRVSEDTLAPLNVGERATLLHLLRRLH